MDCLKAISLRASERPVTCVRYNPDGDLLFTCGHDGLVSVWSTKTGERLGTYFYNRDKPHDASEKVLTNVEHISQAVEWLDVNQKSTQLAVAVFDHIVFYEVETGRYLTHIEEVAKVETVEWNQHPLKQNLILTCHSARGGASPAIPSVKVYIADSEEGRSTRWELMLEIIAFEGDPTVACWGPLDESIIAGCDSGKIYRWDRDGNQLGCVTAHKGAVTCMSFNRDRTAMLTGSDDMTACLWDVATFREIKRFTTDRPLRGCGMSPLFDHPDDKKRKPHIILAGGQEAEKVTVTGAEEGMFETIIINAVYENEIGRIQAHYSPTWCLDIAPDGSGFATGAFEGNAKLHSFSQAFMEMDHHA